MEKQESYCTRLNRMTKVPEQVNQFINCPCGCLNIAVSYVEGAKFKIFCEQCQEFVHDSPTI